MPHVRVGGSEACWMLHLQGAAAADNHDKALQDSAEHQPPGPPARSFLLLRPLTGTSTGSPGALGSILLVHRSVAAGGGGQMVLHHLWGTFGQHVVLGRIGPPRLHLPQHASVSMPVWSWFMHRCCLRDSGPPVSTCTDMQLHSVCVCGNGQCHADGGCLKHQSLASCKPHVLPSACMWCSLSCVSMV